MIFIKKIIVLLALIVVLIMVLLLVRKSIINLRFVNTVEDNYNESQIPPDYIAIFLDCELGEFGTYATYIYKIDNGNENEGFYYINVKKTTFSGDWRTLVTDRGIVQYKNDVFQIAKDNLAYLRVVYGDKSYSIEEFKNVFYNNE